MRPKRYDGRLLICGFGPFPGVAANPSALVVERLRAESWAPAGANTAFAVLPVSWAGAVSALRTHIEETGAEGVLLSGVASDAHTFRVELRARNDASTTHPDVEGAIHPGPHLIPRGRASLRASGPAAAILSAIRTTGLPAETSSDAGDYLCNATLYHLLCDRLDDPHPWPVSFLHLPSASETFSISDLTIGVKAAAQVMARTLAFLPDRALNQQN